MKFQVGEKVKVCRTTFNAPSFLNDEEGIIIDHSGSVDSTPDCYVVDFDTGTHFLLADDLESTIITGAEPCTQEQRHDAK